MMMELNRADDALLDRQQLIQTCVNIKQDGHQLCL